MTTRSNHNFRKLNAWTEAIDLVMKVYELIHRIPSKNNYGIIDQIKRAAISIPSNIAEGSARSTNRDFVRHLYISKGSIAELLSLLTVSNRLGLISQTDEEHLTEELVRIDNMLYKLIIKLDQPSSSNEQS